MNKNQIYGSPSRGGSLSDHLINTALVTAGMDTHTITLASLGVVRPVLSNLHLTPLFDKYLRRRDWAGEHLDELIASTTLGPDDNAVDPDSKWVFSLTLPEMAKAFIDLAGASAVEEGMHNISVALSLEYRDAIASGVGNELQLFSDDKVLYRQPVTGIERQYHWGDNIPHDIMTNTIVRLWPVLYAAAVLGNSGHRNTPFQAQRLMHTPPTVAAVYVALSVSTGKLHTFDALSDPWNFVLSDHVALYITQALLSQGFECASLLISDVESGLFTTGLADSRPDLVMEGFVDYASALLEIDPPQ